MSEQNDHPSEDKNEEETNLAIDKEKAEKSESKTELELAVQQIGPMLEDEEMPSCVSISSHSCGEDYDPADNRTQTSQQYQNQTIPSEEHSRSPYESEDQEGGSIYVVSSREGSDRPPYDDEDEEDYEDSDDLGQRMYEDDEDDEDEDEEEEYHRGLANDRYDDIQDCYDEAHMAAYDDFMVKHYKRWEPHHKKKSLSLQDLSSCKQVGYTSFRKKQRSLDILKEDPIDYSANVRLYSPYKRNPSSFKYRHVESKVKRYINNIKEQNRQSMERKVKKPKPTTINSNHSEVKDPLNEEKKAPSVTVKNFKNYAKKVFEELEIEELCEVDKTEELKNGEDVQIEKIEIDQQAKLIGVKKDIPIEVSCEKIPKEQSNFKADEKIDKCNGVMEVDVDDNGISISPVKISKLGNEACIANGHETAPTFYNMRSVSYEEYMHGGTTVAPVLPANNEEVYPLKIDNIQTISMSSQQISQGLRRADQELSEMNSELDKKNAEITILRVQLDQKNVQYDNLRDTYQKTLQENLKMKQELDELKKALIKCEKENQPRETKVAAVQTETIQEPEPTTDTHKIHSKHKFSATSIGSGFSSTEQWPESSIESTDNVSLRPPNVAGLNSTDSSSYVIGTPKNSRHLSRAFITSSRILQTLSNITQGKKSQIEHSMSHHTLWQTPNDHSQNAATTPTDQQPAGSKKRKATEMSEHNSFSQPFKIPHTTSGPRRKSMSSNDNDSVFKHPELNSFNKSSKSQLNSSIPCSSGGGGESSNFSKNQSKGNNETTTVSDDTDDNVKCFVYREDDTSEDRSFLIQAGEPKGNKFDEKSRVRECGPYLLGNMEIRMSEVNGLINIWGKELGQASMIEHEEIEISQKIDEHESTPQTSARIAPSMTCSTSKKSKCSPRIKYDEYSRLSSIKTSSSMINDDTNCTQYNRVPSRMDSRVRSCEHLENSSKHGIIPHSSCNSRLSQKKTHSDCCAEYKERAECCCAWGEKRRSNSPISNKIKQTFLGTRKYLQRNFGSEPNVCSHRINNDEVCCEQHLGYEKCRRYSVHDNDEDPRCRSCNHHQNEIFNQPSTSASCGNCTCHHKSMNEDEQVPLISVNETPETRQRRLSGKKVRGILMDFLKGCGDCRDPDLNNSSNRRDRSHGKDTSSCSPKVTPQIKVTSSCSDHPHSNERCCRQYVHHLESQLEQVRVEMERVRSRSDDILDMLKTLYSLDAN